MRKTVVVRVDRLRRHEKYLKYFRVSKRYKAHDERGEYHAGDYVVIEETRPLSHEKRWRVVELISRATDIPAVSDVRVLDDNTEVAH